MTRRHVHLLISAIAWLGFAAITVWTMAFLADVVVPRTVDGPPRTTTGWAITIDLTLLGLFAVQHSVMARRSVKAWLGRRVPAALERTTFILATNACLALLLAFWQPWGGEVWQVDGAAAFVLWALCAAGWILALASTFAVDHLELIGLRQAGWVRPRDFADAGLQTGGLHSVVRHPLMTGLLLASWATPHMGASHLLFAVVMTGYVTVGIRFEERDLRRTFGTSYDAYASRVPSIIPGLRPRPRPVLEPHGGSR